MNRLSFITQFKIEFLLLFNSHRKVLGKMAVPTEKTRLKLATFRHWAKGSREVASEVPTVLYIHFCSFYNNYLITLIHLVNMA